MQEVKIGNGSVFAEINYDKGGYSYFTSSSRLRGYYILVQNKLNEFQAFAGLDQPSGAARMLIEETSRYSKKKHEALTAEIDSYVEELLKQSASAGKLPLVFADYEKVDIKGE